MTTKYTAKSSAQEHRPPLFSQLPKVAAIEEKQPIVPAPKTAIRDFPVDLPVDGTLQQELTTASQTSTDNSNPSPILHTSLPPEPPLSPQSSRPPKITVPPKVSQVSKLLNAISTWVSVPQEQLQIRDTSTSSTLPAERSSDVQICGSEGHSVHDTTETEIISRDTDMISPDKEATMMLHDADPTSHDDARMSHGVESTSYDRAAKGKGVSHDKGGEEAVSHDEEAGTETSHDICEASHDKEAFDQTSDGSEAKGVSTEGVEIFLPPVDGVSVSRIQRSLFNSQLRQHLQRVCSSLNLSFHQVLPQVTKTTSQFRYGGGGIPGSTIISGENGQGIGQIMCMASQAHFFCEIACYFTDMVAATPSCGGGQGSI